MSVNPGFTPDPPQPRRRHAIDAPMVLRMIRAYGRSCADGDPADLATLLDIERELRDVIGRTVAHMRTEQLWTWESIAGAAGITRQGAYQRWGRFVSASSPAPAGDKTP